MILKIESWELIKKGEREVGSRVCGQVWQVWLLLCCCWWWTGCVDVQQQQPRPCVRAVCSVPPLNTHHVLHLPRSSPKPTTPTRTNSNQCATTQHTTSPVCCPLSCVPTHPHTSMLLCRPVCPTLAHAATPCVKSSPPHNTCCLCTLILRHSCLVCVQHTPLFQHHPTLRCHCPFNQCAATSLHSPSTQTTHHAMCCLPLPIKYPHKPHPTHRGCSLLSRSCTTHSHAL